MDALYKNRISFVPVYYKSPPESRMSSVGTLGPAMSHWTLLSIGSNESQGVGLSSYITFYSTKRLGVHPLYDTYLGYLNPTSFVVIKIVGVVDAEQGIILI